MLARKYLNCGENLGNLALACLRTEDSPRKMSRCGHPSLDRIEEAHNCYIDGLINLKEYNRIREMATNQIKEAANVIFENFEIFKKEKTK